MAQFGFGQAMRRSEDPRLLTGRGRYTDDVMADGQAYLVLVRSPFAHAEITGLDVSAAREADGVLDVITGADLEAAGIGTVGCKTPVPNRDGRPSRRSHRSATRRSGAGRTSGTSARSTDRSPAR